MNPVVMDVLSAARTYYVRTAGAANPGNDSNNGLANDASHAWLTLGHAVEFVSRNINLNGYDCTIQLADDNNINEGIILPTIQQGTGKLIVQGNASTPANVIINATGVGGTCFQTSAPSTFKLKDMKLVGTGRGIDLLGRGTIEFQNLDFGTNGTHLRVLYGGFLKATGNYSISGNCATHWESGFGGLIEVAGKTITITGTPAWSSAFAYAHDVAALSVYGNTFSGSATGKRWTTGDICKIYTGSSGSATYLPGNSNGTAGGTYGIYW